MMATTGTARTLLLYVGEDYTFRIGIPPKDPMDSFFKRSTIIGNLRNISHVACNPGGELFVVRGEDLYRGAMPSNKDVDWFSLAKRVGKSEWGTMKLIFFHPNGDLYATTRKGAFYKGSPPDNEHIPWIYETATKIGGRFWDRYDAMFFDPDGILYAVSNADKMFKAPPPTDEHCLWIDESTEIGFWRRLTHFMAISPDRKLWSVDKYNGNVYRGEIPAPGPGDYISNAKYLGWNYHISRFLAFTKDTTVQNIINFEFLPDEGIRVSETPEVLEEKVYDNRRSSSTLKHSFTFEKTIRQSSSFSHEHGFTFQVGAEIGFTTGVPCIAEGSMKLSMDMSTTNNWNFTETNETEATFSSTTDVELGAGKAIRLVASVVKAQLNVPYKARVRTLYGSEVEIRGTWHGVSHYNLKVTQEDYTK